MAKSFIKALCIGLLLHSACIAAPNVAGVSGKWNVNGEEIQLAAPTDTLSIATVGDLAGDLTIEGDFLWASAGKKAQVYFIFSYHDAQNYACVAFDKQQYKAWNNIETEDLYTVGIYNVIGGKEILTNVSAWMRPTNGIHHVKLVVADQQVLVSMDGKEIIQGGILSNLLNGRAAVAAKDYAANFSNLKVSQTAATTRLFGIGYVNHDKNGQVVPRWPWSRMITSPMEYTFWAAENAPGNWVRDEYGKTWPPYVYACTINLNGTVGNPTNYPPQEFAFFNNGLLDYYMYTGDKRALQRAEQLASWLLDPAHLIPDPAWPAYKLSITKTNVGSVVGDVDGKSIYLWPYGEVGEMKEHEVGQSLISLEEQGAVGITILRLFHLTGEWKYLGYCINVADALLRLQLPDGRWNYRINPKDGNPNDDWTANVYDNIIFLDELAASTGRQAYYDAARKAEKWFVEVPCQSNRWLGIFGDVPSNVHLGWASNYKGDAKENYSGFVAMGAGRHLLAMRDKHPEYVKKAEDIRSWIYTNFLRKDSNNEAQIAEQVVCFVVMPYHGFHESMLEADLYEATGKGEYKKMGMHFLNAGMYQSEVNGFILLMGGGLSQATADMWWCNVYWAPQAYVYAMGTWPEMAPKGENHLVRVSAPITSISYDVRGVHYGTARESTDRLVLAARPKSVRCGGQNVPECKISGKGYGWTYNEKTRLMKIYHPGGKVDITVGKLQIIQKLVQH